MKTQNEVFSAIKNPLFHLKISFKSWYVADVTKVWVFTGKKILSLINDCDVFVELAIDRSKSKSVAITYLFNSCPHMKFVKKLNKTEP